MEVENINLMWTPHTKKLLENYVLTQYEENADLSDDSLIREFRYLHDNNQLDQLFLCEYITSPERLQNEFA